MPASNASIGDIATYVSLLVNAGRPELSKDAASHLLDVIGKGLFKEARVLPSPQPVPVGYNSSVRLNAPLLSISGSPPDVMAAATAALDALTSVLIASAPRGRPESVSNAPVEGTTRGGAPYCGFAVTRTAMQPLPDAPISFELFPAMNPCMPSVASGRGSLPSTIIAAQPPPSLTTSAAASAALRKAVPGATVSLTQWGVSPLDESAGVNRMSYAAPPALSDIALKETAAAAAALANAPARRLARALGVTALDAVIAATGGTSAATAAQGALTAAAPRPTTAVDLLPNRPLDSRVLSVRVADEGDKSVTLESGVFPVSVTVPFRDLSIVKWDSVLKTATVDVGNTGFLQPVISVTCPVSPAAASFGGVVASFVNGGDGAAAVRVESVQLATYTDVVGTSTVNGAGESVLGAVAAPEGASVATDLLSVSAKSGKNGSATEAGTVGSVLSAKAPVTTSSAHTYVLSFDCKGAFGRQTFVCGVGFAGAKITYACPAVIATPSCLRYNSSARGWTTAGCSVESTSVTSAVCACDGPGDVAVRFAALAQQQVDVFALGSASSASAVVGVWMGYFVLLGIVCALNLLGVLIADGARVERWVLRLAADPEMVRAQADGGPSWSLGVRGYYSAKVAPVTTHGADKSPRKGGAGSIAPVGGSLSRDSAVAALGSALLNSSAAGRVSARTSSKDALDECVREWRTAILVSGTVRPRPRAPPPLAAITHARLLRGEPPALLVGVRPLCFCRRAHYFSDESSSALAAPPLTRFLGAVLAVTASAAGTTVLYAYVLAVSKKSATPALEGLSTLQTLSLALASAVCVQTLTDALVMFVLRWRARDVARSRFPGLAKERDQRARAAAILDPLPTSALLQLSVAAARRGAPTSPLLLSPEEAFDADGGAPPGCDAELPRAMVHAWWSPVAGLCGRLPHQRASRAADAAAAAGAIGLDAAAQGASAAVAALSTLRGEFDESGAGVQPPSSALRAAAVDFILACLAAFCLFYAIAFAFTRGATATSAAAGAWTLGVFFSLFLVRPVLEAARVRLAFATHGALRFTSVRAAAAPLEHYLKCVALPAAAAAACAASAAPADAAVALLPPEVLATAATLEGVTAAHLALRRAALVQAYLALIAADEEEESTLPPTIKIGSSGDGGDDAESALLTVDPSLNESPTPASAFDDPSPLTARFGQAVLSNPDSAWRQHLRDAGIASSFAASPVASGWGTRAATPRAPLAPAVTAAPRSGLPAVGSRSIPLPLGPPPSTLLGRAGASITVITGVRGLNTGTDALAQIEAHNT